MPMPSTVSVTPAPDKIAQPPSALRANDPGLSCSENTGTRRVPGNAVSCSDAEAWVAAPAKDAFKNYMTPAGYRRLRDELAQLWKIERPALVTTVAWAAGNGDRSENGDYIYGKRKLREIDRRIRHLSKSLDSAVVVDNSGRVADRVFFGATVTIAGRTGDQRIVTIVGTDELGAGGERVSWRSPLASALLKARVGDVVTVRTPLGPEPQEIVAIRYDPGRWEA